jgi:hypothetical protein
MLMVVAAFILLFVASSMAFADIPNDYNPDLYLHSEHLDIRYPSDLTDASLLAVISDLSGPAVTFFCACDEVEGYRDYKINSTHKFKKGFFSKASFYAEISELECSQVSEGYRLIIEVGVIVYDSAGERKYRKDPAHSLDEVYAWQVDSVFIQASAPTMFMGRGDYLVEVIIRDLISETESRIFAFASLE